MADITDNSTPLMDRPLDSPRPMNWWPLIAIPLFFVLGWATNDAMSANYATNCPNIAPTTSVVTAPF